MLAQTLVMTCAVTMCDGVTGQDPQALCLVQWLHTWHSWLPPMIKPHEWQLLVALAWV
jgi:hypothetical protein